MLAELAVVAEFCHLQIRGCRGAVCAQRLDSQMRTGEMSLDIDISQTRQAQVAQIRRLGLGQNNCKT